MKILVVIPARGGSKGIPRKNVRLIAGHPLISYAIGCVQKSSFDVDLVVSSDDEEIMHVASVYGAEIVERPKELAGDSVTLDPVIFHAVNQVEKQKGYTYDLVITMQPTSPKLSTITLDKAIRYMIEEDYDTVLSGVNDPRLSWKFENGECVPNYKVRVNRQYMPKEVKETGAFVITKRQFVKNNSRFGKKISIYEVPESEAGDIDTVSDWYVAEKELNKKIILIRLDGYQEIGMGHIYRGLQLAYGFIEHDIRFVLSDKSILGIEKIRKSFYKYDIIKEDEDIITLIHKYKADIVINDILNTSEDYIKKLKATGVRVINFEDIGTGALVADATINALYEGVDTKNQFWGADYYLIRDEFVIEKPKEFSEKVSEILVVFGGTDPNNLTKKTLDAILGIKQLDKINVTVILGMGYSKAEEIRKLCNENCAISVVQDVKMMTDYMKKADIAISSQGRTMLELAAMGVPTILMAQNEREAIHEFGEIKNGYLNLGNGSEVDEKTIRETIQWLINCPQIRKNMQKQMLSRNLKMGMSRVKKIILGESRYD